MRIHSQSRSEPVTIDEHLWSGNFYELELPPYYGRWIRGVYRRLRKQLGVGHSASYARWMARHAITEMLFIMSGPVKVEFHSWSDKAPLDERVSA